MIGMNRISEMREKVLGLFEEDIHLTNRDEFVKFSCTYFRGTTGDHAGSLLFKLSST